MLCVFGFERRNERVAANYNKAVLATIGELLAVQSIAQVSLCSLCCVCESLSEYVIILINSL